jgi:calcineurin-like phosphoesterase family protein
METYLISDSHYGHANICKFLREDGTKLRPWDTPEEMDAFMVERWNSVVKPGDVVYHLGDVAMNRRHIQTMGLLNGSKRLILGNHDIFDHSDYAPYFKRLHGSLKLDDLLLSHIPVHRDSVAKWTSCCVHGHIHASEVMQRNSQGNISIDPLYFNVCVEQIDYQPMPLYLVKEHIASRKKLNAETHNASNIAIDLI